MKKTQTKYLKTISPKTCLILSAETSAIAAIEETTTNNLQPLTEMEVHHHPDLHHKPKAWKEYLLEGLMIFLAVTMGFIQRISGRKLLTKKDCMIMCYH